MDWPVLRAGDVIDGRFEVLALARQGSSGKVYRAYDRDGAREVALELIAPIDAARLAEQVALLARLHHPRIVAYVAHGYASWPYLAVEWLEGIDLEHLLEQRSLSTAEALRVSMHLCEALAHAHALGIAHGRLEPARVILVAGAIEKLELLDFVAPSSPAGAAYRAPELAGLARPTAAADLFSLGVLIERLFRPAPPGELGRMLAAMRATDPAARPALAAVQRTLGALFAEHTTTRAAVPPTVDMATAPGAACPSEARLSEYLEGLLDEPARDAVELHLDRCPGCARLVGAYARAHLGSAEPPPSVAAASIGIGASIGRYTLVDVLGMGGVGIVYRAIDRQLDREVALKLLLDRRRGERAQQRMLREARALAQLSHPNVVAVHDAGLFGTRAYVVMEYIAGRRLDVWMREEGRTRDEVMKALFQVGEGLSAAHEAGLVHRDVKPANAMVGDDGRVRVVDFGLVRFHDADPRDGFRTTAGAFLGTPRFMAPEQRRGAEVDARADQYSFSLVLFDALYRGGRPDDDPIQSFTPDPADRLFPVIERGLRVRPEERHPDMRTLLSALRAALAGERVPRARTVTIPFEAPAALYLLIARPPPGTLEGLALSDLTHTLLPSEAFRSPRADAARELAERAGGRATLLPTGLLTARFRAESARPEPAATRAVQCALALVAVLGVPALAVVADDSARGDLTLEAIGRADALLALSAGGAVRLDERVAAQVWNETAVQRDSAGFFVTV